MKLATKRRKKRTGKYWVKPWLKPGDAPDIKIVFPHAICGRDYQYFCA
jgi:hypothetical protein